MAAITICYDLGAQKNKVSHCFPVYLPWSDGTRCSISDLPVLHSLPEFDPSSCTLNHWCYLTISSSATLFSFCLQSFPASGSSTLRQLFVSGGQNIGASASALVLPMNSQGWFPLGYLVWSPCCPRDSQRVFASTTVRKHQFFGIQPSLWSNSHIRTWLLEKP